MIHWMQFNKSCIWPISISKWPQEPVSGDQRSRDNLAKSKVEFDTPLFLDAPQTTAGIYVFDRE